MATTFVGPLVEVPGAPAAVNANGNRVLDSDRPVHEWYRFVLSFPPHIVRSYLESFGVLDDIGHAPVARAPCVLDPFCGTGTTLVECKKLGIAAFGIEATPMGAFASAV